MQTSLTLKESIQQTDYRECQMDNKSLHIQCLQNSR